MQLVPRALLGMVALLLGNAYIVGINQIYDVDIDKVNNDSLVFCWRCGICEEELRPFRGFT